MTGTWNLEAQRGGMTHGDAYVALLRGINLGDKNRLPMKDLVVLFERAGCHDVRTYIQSGNVVFRAAPALAPHISNVIPRAVSEAFGFAPPVVTRTPAELRKVSRDNPFLTSGADPRALHVAFLADRPAAAKVRTLDPNRSAPDEFVVRGREIYLYFPNGLGRSKLTNMYFDSTLGTVSTVRNWRTVLKLLDLVEGR